MYDLLVIVEFWFGIMYVVFYFCDILYLFIYLIMIYGVRSKLIVWYIVIFWKSMIWLFNIYFVVYIYISCELNDIRRCKIFEDVSKELKVLFVIKDKLK